ncbi:class I SAM-dependent methyltransferase [Corynebacterium cystitidis]|uniref:Methyltransferase domain-containing protein n=1 Tax=Corynebacterium cystitidis DSM 20524 TaxID=1121357 RepID=A0A1H9VBJ5_9CORY|nr:class I SAM-dependent methyltransferase [Corynebacterium cystitidis]WJY82307.1 Demethylmenaquinone methyltransferase [Corynebacterium cystitidis DSM 20524]SES19062.1 Methyltransferase domain-containing protein [Corynebacterium cystitidis DSM 20524]SNV76603.1 SAM-dependent methyltransferase [Corynebacterium cystitidis]
MNTPSHANRTYWDSDAARYHDEHPAYLTGFNWCPEMLSEENARLLGDVVGKRVLEVGCGSAPCSTWLADDQPGAFVTAFDISAGMLSHSLRAVPLVQADVLALPYRTGAFDVAFSAFGALPFIRDEVAALQEIRRVLSPDARFIFSVNHPMRWVFPDDPSSFTAEISYFAREYEEYDDTGALVYAEYHRTFGDWVRAIRAADFELVDVIEPEWPEELTENWGQWSPERGHIFPGTAIFITCSRPL